MILDLSLEEGSGLSLIEDLHATQPGLPVLVVSMHDETLYARWALEAGARGYLMKDRADSKVVEAIRTVLDGSVYISSEVTSAIVSGQVGGTEPSSDDSVLGVLSDRELEVFTLMGEGKERREIAEALALSPKTVDSHRTSLKDKLSFDTNAMGRLGRRVFGRRVFGRCVLGGCVLESAGSGDSTSGALGVPAGDMARSAACPLGGSEDFPPRIPKNSHGTISLRRCHPVELGFKVIK